jgi:chlorite dismutase
LIPAEGWHVLHLFYTVDHGQWSLMDEGERLAARTALNDLVTEIQGTDQCQLLTFAMMTPRVDLGFMLLCADLHLAQKFEKQLTLGLGADVLRPAFSFYSLTERSEYLTTDDEFAAQLQAEEQLTPGSEAFEKRMGEFRARMAKYVKDKLYPVLPPWEIFCFYPMLKRRGLPGQNWYALSHEERRKLMGGHARVGRQWHGKILQLITGSTGLDDWEWGVTLLAHDSADIKGIVYQMRFDEVTAQYAEFGEFFIGLQLPMDEIFRRLAV